jgi:hypothetical protein
MNEFVNSLAATDSDTDTSKPIAGKFKPFDESRAAMGPISRHQIAQTEIMFLLVFATSGTLLLLSNSVSLDVFSLGLMFPGGGFLYCGHYLTAAVILLFSFFCLTGHRIFLPLVWFGSAVGGSLMTRHMEHQFYEVFLSLIPILVAGLYLTVKFYSLISEKKRRDILKRDNEQIPTALHPLIRSNMQAIGDLPDDEDWLHLKYILDRALQPIDSFNGYTMIDPYLTSALRYQLNFSQYTLALYQYSHTPAFRGYLSEGQRNLIDKMTNKKVWQYWSSENKWGNLDNNPDPVARDNIMYSGYLGCMIGMYETMHPDQPYSQPNSLPLQWNEETHFNYDFNSLNEAIYKNFDSSVHTLFPCEPNWVYSMCNSFAINSLKMGDRLNGTQYYENIRERYLRSLKNEYMSIDGHFIPIRSTVWGVVVPWLNMDLNDGICTFLNHAIDPTLSESCWQYYRNRRFDATTSVLGEYKIQRSTLFDLGNYKPNRAGTIAMLMLSAKELGDMQSYNALKDALKKSKNQLKVTGDDIEYVGASNLTVFTMAMARLTRPGAFYDLVNNGMPEQWLTGPILNKVPYPDIFVKRAVNNDKTLSMVLKPTNGITQFKMEIARLQSNTVYRIPQLNDKQFTSDSEGIAVIEVPISGELALDIIPLDSQH